MERVPFQHLEGWNVYVRLETERLLLRRFTADDLDNLVELDSDPEVMRFLTGGKPTRRETVRDEVLPAILAGYDRWPGFGRWVTVEKATGAFVGWCGLQPRHDGPTDELELGYRIRRAFWGRGYATECSRALIDAAFRTTDGAGPAVRRVFAETMAVNTRSRRVMERSGLRYLRTFHLTWDDPIEGPEHGEVEYEATRPDWNRQHAAHLG
ncbi:MAG TPA: GNAT family N-acetyltransferase [Micromonospora sp.]